MNYGSRAVAAFGIVFGLAVAGTVAATHAQAATDSREGVTEEDGKYVTEDGGVTYHVGEDGTVDWYTYSGFRRYHSECHVCHGPDGMGSTYAPALKDSVKTMDYYQFSEVVMSGRVNHKPDGSESVMPAFGDNQNVACYVEDLYAYLKARSDEALGRGRPSKKANKPDTAKENEDACFGR